MATAENKQEFSRETKNYPSQPNYFGARKQILLNQRTSWYLTEQSWDRHSNLNGSDINDQEVEQLTRAENPSNIDDSPTLTGGYVFSLKPYLEDSEGLITTMECSLAAKVKSIVLFENSIPSPFYIPNYNFLSKDTARSCLLTLQLNSLSITLSEPSREALGSTSAIQNNPYQVANYCNNIQLNARIRHPFLFSRGYANTAHLSRADLDLMFLVEGSGSNVVQVGCVSTPFQFKPFSICSHELKAIKNLTFDFTNQRKIGVFCPLQRPMLVYLARAQNSDDNYRFFLALKGVKRPHEQHTTHFFIDWVDHRSNFELPEQNGKFYYTYPLSFLKDISGNTKLVLDRGCCSGNCPFFTTNPILTTYDTSNVIVDLENILMDPPTFLSYREISTFLPSNPYWKAITYTYPRKIIGENGEMAFETLVQDGQSNNISVIRTQHGDKGPSQSIYISTPYVQSIGPISKITIEQLDEFKSNRLQADQQLCFIQNTMSYYPFKVMFKPR